MGVAYWSGSIRVQSAPPNLEYVTPELPKLGADGDHALRLLHPPAMGLALVNISAQRKHFLRHTLLGFNFKNDPG
jgi:hypothetical protein